MSTNLSIQEFSKDDLRDWLDDEETHIVDYLDDEIEIPIFHRQRPAFP
jgi:hypothetical protein